jgi:MarR family transcriptional regulator, 2-MHQ and catechol-resistance regulon repressor
MTARGTAPEHDAVTTDAGSARAYDLWVDLARAHAALSAYVSAVAARHGLSLTELHLLETLLAEGPIPLGELQRHVLVSSGGVTFLVDRLVVKGLVKRRLSTVDRRSCMAALTPKGAKLVARVQPLHAAAIRRASSVLTRSQRRVLDALLRTLAS